MFASSLSYEAPNPIILYAKFIREYPGDWSPRTDAEIAGELVNAADEVVAEVDLRDDGQERDIEARRRRVHGAAHPRLPRISPSGTA